MIKKYRFYSQFELDITNQVAFIHIYNQYVYGKLLELTFRAKFESYDSPNTLKK